VALIAISYPKIHPAIKIQTIAKIVDITRQAKTIRPTASVFITDFSESLHSFITVLPRGLVSPTHHYIRVRVFVRNEMQTVFATHLITILKEK